MRKIVLLGTFFSVAPLTLLMLAVLLGTGQISKTNISFLRMTQHYILFQALPANNTQLDSQNYAADARTLILKKFFRRYNSPLEKHSEKIVEQADFHNIDYRLIPAIAMQESTGCKFIPDNSYNCWGYGIYGDKVTRFQNYDEGIETVTRGLRKNYYEHGLTTPQAIMRKYTPPSLELGGPWASGVEYFFYQIETQQ